MAAHDTNHLTATGVPARLGIAISNMTQAVADWNNIRQTRNALSKLSDHELNDIGLSRGDLYNLGR